MMRNLIRTAALLALLGSRAAMARTVGPSPAGPANAIMTLAAAPVARRIGRLTTPGRALQP